MFGTEVAASSWLEHVRAASSANLALFGASATDSTHPDRTPIDGNDALAVLRAAMRTWPGEDLILLRANTMLPPHWFARLARAMRTENVLVASPLDNVEPERSPLIAGAHSTTDAATIDALCHAYARNSVIEASAFSPLLSLWNGAYLLHFDVNTIDAHRLPQTLSPLRSVVLDHLYVADPTRTLRGPALVPPGGDAVPPSPLGELREKVCAALDAEASVAPPAYFGLDERGVILHVLHGWGGGAERFVRDLATADGAHHHLVLVARGNFPRRRYGESLDLLDAASTLPALRSATLPDPIRSSTTGDATYRHFLDAILRDFRVDAVLVSSLIGHSLDVLRTGRPTWLIAHDCYPCWPILHRDFGDPRLAFDDAQLVADLDRAPTDFEFAERDPAYWRRLRDDFATAALAANVGLIAPSRTALHNLLRVEPRFAALRATVIAHGLAPWPPGSPAPVPAPPARERLRLVVPGRVRQGKGAQLLRAALPELRQYADIYLLGAGAEGEQFFGEANVHIVLDYRRDELPALLARLRPDAALLLPTVAETFSYTLSEMFSLCIPVVGTRVGALAERIDDGVTGWLVDPEPGAVAACIARLAQNRLAIAMARMKLAALVPRDAMQMAADYAALLPATTQPATSPPQSATLDGNLAQTRAGLLGEAQRRNTQLSEALALQRTELAQRVDWAIDLERDLRRGQKTLAERERLLVERTEWAQAAATRENAANEALAERERLLVERTEWAQAAAARENAANEALAERERLLVERTEWAKAASVRENAANEALAERERLLVERTEWAQAAAARELAARDELTRFAQAHDALRALFDERSLWAQDLDAQLRLAREQYADLDARFVALGNEYAGLDARFVALGNEYAGLDARFLTLGDEHANLVTAHAQLHDEFDERTRWALLLDSQLQEMRASTSWRITGPLRFVLRKVRGARARAGFQVQRVRSAVSRTRGSLARRGLSGTFRRIGEEFARKRGAPVPAPIVSAPSACEDASLQAFSLPTSQQPQVSIVVPVYNKIEYTLACLCSLGEQAGSIPFEVLVVDDGSSDATQEQLARIDGIRVVRNARNLGFIGSCNAGAALARGEYVLFLNNDTVVTSGWLEALLACFAEEPDAGLVGAKLVYPDGRLQEAGGIVFRDGSGWNYGRFDNPTDPRYEYRREADYCSGAAIMLPRALFEQLGGFDTRYTPAYYEDTDLAFAVRAAGKKVFYEPRSVVVHFEGITSGTDTGSGVKQYQIVNREKFLDKWRDALALQPAPIDSEKFAASAANFRHPRHVLIVDAYTPTPDQDSGSLRMLNVMRLLREAGWRVSFLPDNWAHAEKYTNALQALGVEALYHPFFNDPAAWLRDNGDSLDAAILSRHYVASKYLDLLRHYAPRASVIFDTVDLHYLRERRSAELAGSAELARQAEATRDAELKLMRECDISLVVSPVEQALLAHEVPQARIEVLSNVHEIHGLRRDYSERADLVFVGGFQHPPNIDAMQWFVAEVFPLVLAHAPRMKLHVIGSKIVDAVRELASDNVIVHGYVEDIAPFMDNCRISIAPLRVGAGVKGKVNMAMSYGLPVVATATAVEGMHVEAGRDVLVADAPGDFADAILRLHDDETLWNTLSANGLANVRSHFSFEAARTALARILPIR